MLVPKLVELNWFLYVPPIFLPPKSEVWTENFADHPTEGRILQRLGCNVARSSIEIWGFPKMVVPQ